ncbi:phospholipase D-like domain-containing protein [Kushneria indalinina]|uniref:Putative cardiolipin synthase n=1 Tax=Kushneria indalinina DSM 14324 TaxID=1122140 RepID=A0A3D9DT76_9GAMM|nr:phospholipase D family protein [Kushneria indalinina]REC93932.1 putative cardiolipin synthase [Kushneria indalinina DSM 14324]
MTNDSNTGALVHWASQHGAASDECSGMRLLSDGLDAFEVRAHLARHAEHSIDSLSYILEEGTTTQVLMAELLAAAERGVDVRMLVDDMSAINVQRKLRAMQTHPRIEVRLFNPVTFWRRHYWSHRLAMALTIRRSHRRMHNKLWLVDGAVGIAGGRNLSDDYFITESNYNFADLDMLVAGGRIADQMRECFSRYWHGHCVRTLAALVPEEPGYDWQALRDELRRKLSGESLADSPFLPIHHDETRGLDEGLGELVQASGELYWDHPDKSCQPGRPGREFIMGPHIGAMVADTQHHIKIVSAYFIPSERDVIDLEALLERDVEVTVLTNSLKASDTPVVNGGYAPWRRRFLERGAHMYELRHGHKPRRRRMYHFGAMASSLHGKAMVMDDKRLFIGSFNVDPRSTWWNNEMGLRVDHDGLVSELDDVIERALSPASSFRVEQDGRGQLSWVTVDENEQEHRLTREPGSLLARAQKWLGGLPGVWRLL